MRASRALVFFIPVLGCNGLLGLDDLVYDRQEDGQGAGPSTGTGTSGGTGPSVGGGGAGSGCEMGRGDCDDDPLNGCESVFETDPDNCGACDFDCAGAVCNAGVCGPGILAQGQASPNDIGVYGDHVYWVNHETGQIMRCEKGGCDLMPTELAVSGDNSYYMKVDEDGVFWNRNSTGEIFQVELDERRGETIVLALEVFPTRVGIDDTHVYWHSNEGEIRRGLKGQPNGPGELIASTQGDSGDVASDGERVYWTSRSLGGVYSCGLDELDNGCAPMTHEPGGVATNTIGFDETTIYFGTSEGVDDALRSVPKQGGPSDVLVPGQSSIHDIAVGDTHVYWVNQVSGGLAGRYSKETGDAEQLDWSFDLPSGIAVDDKYAYVADRSAEIIVRLPR